SHRHPAWSEEAGFPSTFDANNPPYLLLFRGGSSFHARLADLARLRRLGANSVPRRVLSESKSIIPAPAALLAAFRVPAETLLETLEEKVAGVDAEVFDPANM